MEGSQNLIHVCVSACVHVCVCVSLSVFLCECVFLCVCARVCMCVRAQTFLCVCMFLSVCVHHAVTFQQQCKADTTCYKGKWVYVCNKGFEDNYQLHSKILA